VALAPGMAVVGHNLFIVDYCDAGGVSTIDLRDPTAPRLLGTSDFPVYHCINDVAVHDETVYVLDRNDLAVVDIEDPEHPVQVSSTMFGPDWSGLTDLLIAEGRLWAVGYGGVMCVADLAESGRFRDLGCRIKAQDDFVTIDVAGGLAGAVVDHPPPLGRRLMVLDVGVPDAPWTLSMTPTAGRAAAVSLSGRLAVVSLGLDGGMEIFDIRTASDPIELSLHQPVVADAAGLAVVGDRLWLAARREGVEIYRLDGCRAPRRPAGRRGDVDPRSVIRH